MKKIAGHILHLLGRNVGHILRSILYEEGRKIGALRLIIRLFEVLQ